MKKFRTGFCAISLLAFILCCSACSTSRTSHGEKVYFAGSNPYQRKLRTLSLNEDQARLRLIEHRRAKGLEKDFYVFDYNRYPVAIVDDNFLFSDSRKVGVDLLGYYVDGHSGKVEFREPSRERRYVHPRNLGFW